MHDGEVDRQLTANLGAHGVVSFVAAEGRFSRAFTTALAVAGGIIGPMLPPPIPMVV